MPAPIDLQRYIQRRQFRAYERDLARASYGYGVDLRRTRWLTTSLLGQAPLRALEHAWIALATTMMAEELRAPETTAEIPMLSEVVDLAKILHTTPPTIRFLRPGAPPSEWGIVTPLADPRGADEWLVIDQEALQRLAPDERAFLLGAGLGHLHCGHGALYLAHLVAYRRRGHSLVRRLLRPWVRVAAFSSDRAGLIAAGELDAALRGLATSEATAPLWAPRFADLALRRAALEEFAETSTAARFDSRRLRGLYDDASSHLAADIASLVGISVEDEDGEDDRDNHRDNHRSGTAKDTSTHRVPSNPETTPPPDDPATGSSEVSSPPRRPAGVPDDAPSLARCDHRLTTRLGLF